MDWDRFHFLCRHYQATPDRLLPGDRDRLQDGELSAFGAPLRPHSLAAELVRQLRSMPDENRRPLLAWYGRQDFNRMLAPSPRVRGVLLYLSALTLMLGFMMGIYHLVVMPGMSEFYTRLEVPGSAAAFTLIDQGSLMFGIVGLLLVLVWLFAWRVWRLYRFAAGESDRFVLRLLPGGIGRVYRELTDLIRMPIHNAGQTWADTRVGRDYQAYSGGQPPGAELPRLIARKADELARRVAIWLRLAMALVGVLIALGTALFLAGAYSPIFSTGAIL
ncbi:hypothetical protein ACFOZ5_04640 [Marinobacter lacisalsi]|uniref:Uncharacterized protein n=1 Tax=Marinobacter lacisalsi TaxID=475979 RepID=A0ABV8QDB7_9GAMM